MLFRSDNIVHLCEVLPELHVDASVGQAHIAQPRRIPLVQCFPPRHAPALLTKQTAVFALLPLGAVMLFDARRSGAPRWWLAPGLAAATATLIAGPWYLRRLAAEWQYLTDSAAANPDMVGPLHALAFYPLALLQQGWAPLVWIALIAVLWRRREHLPGALLVATVVGVVLLIGVPKKYPRLLVVQIGRAHV